jgi:hypothetical protein
MLTSYNLRRSQLIEQTNRDLGHRCWEVARAVSSDAQLTNLTMADQWMFPSAPSTRSLLSHTSHDTSNPQDWIVVFMVTALLLLFLIALNIVAIKSHQSSQKISSVSPSPLLLESLQEFKASLVESAVPIMFRSSPYWQRTLQIFSTSHPWFSILFPAPGVPPAPFRRLFSLFSKVCLIYFLSAVLYEHAERGYTTCTSHHHEGSCEDLYSFLNVGHSMCLWESSEEGEGEGRCRRRNLNDDIMRLVFVAVLVGAVHSPFWLLLDHLILTRLGPEHDSKPSSQDEEIGTSSSRSLSSALILALGKEDSESLALRREYTELIQTVHSESTVEKLSDPHARLRFMISWGLFEETNPLFQHLRLSREIIRQDLPLLLSPLLSSQDKTQLLVRLWIGDLLPTCDALVYRNQSLRHIHLSLPLSSSSSLPLRPLLFAFLLLLDSLMLLYTVFFWSRASAQSQLAFLFSFLIWLALDLFLFQTFFLAWSHLILSSRAMPAIDRAKTTVTRALLDLSSTSNGNGSEFNAARSLFSSVRVAQLAPSHVSERDTLLNLKTLIPPQPLSRPQSLLDQLIASAISLSQTRTPLCLPPLLCHDLLLLPFATIFSGGLVMLEIFLYRLEPLLLLFPFEVLVVILAILFLLSLAKPSPPPSQVSPTEHLPLHLSSSSPPAAPRSAPLPPEKSTRRPVPAPLPSHPAAEERKEDEVVSLQASHPPLEISATPPSSSSLRKKLSGGLLSGATAGGGGRGSPVPAARPSPTAAARDRVVDFSTPPAHQPRSDLTPIPATPSSRPPLASDLSSLLLATPPSVPTGPAASSPGLGSLAKYSSIRELYASRRYEPALLDDTFSALPARASPELARVGFQSVKGSLILADD